MIGLNPHSDGIGLTILLQINETEGLQIKKDGIWVPVKPLPNAFIVNIGDMLEVNDQHFSKAYGFIEMGINFKTDYKVWPKTKNLAFYNRLRKGFLF